MHLCSPDGGYQDGVVFDYSQLIALAVLSGLLLLFSTLGSAFLLRGYWVRFLLIGHLKFRLWLRPCAASLPPAALIPSSVIFQKERRQKAKVSEEEVKDGQTAQGSVDASSPSPSFYAVSTISHQ